MTLSAEPAPPAGRTPAAVLRGAHLERRLTATLPLAPGEVRARLLAATHATTEPFTLLSKLSGGGIVTRALRTPDTDRPFFGRVQGDRFTVAPVVRGESQTPFQPLLRGTLAAAAGGTALTLSLAPHPSAQNWDVVFTIAGVGLVLGAAVQSLTHVPMAVGLGAFGLTALAFPRLRARASFALECRRALAALAIALDAPELAEPE